MSPVINLCFHGIGRCEVEREPGEAGYWVSRALFEEVLDEVAGRPEVRISFDDGNRSDLEVALPALQQRGLTATFYVLAGRLHDPRSLTGAEIGELRSQGMQIGSHGMDHVPWAGLDDATLDREVRQARDVLQEASGGPVEVAALPLGRYDRRVVRRVRAAGFGRLGTSDQLPARSGSWLQPRYSLRFDDRIETVRTRALTPPPPAVRARRTATVLVKRYAPTGISAVRRRLVPR